jgi:glutathione S-transferase
MLLLCCWSGAIAGMAPSWTVLRDRVLSSPAGKQLHHQAELRAQGLGEPSAKARLRLFDAVDEAAVRVTLYRDDSAWCPYCQKTWLLLEEKRVPYRVQTLPLNAYGYKPAWYTRLVDGGGLPAIELDGKLHTESLEIMRLLDATFASHSPQMVATAGTAAAEQEAECLALEQVLVRDWFSLCFYPVEGEALQSVTQRFVDSLAAVDRQLATTAGPWFMGGDHPSLVDLQFVATIERIEASTLYWKGLRLRGSMEEEHAGQTAGDQALRLPNLCAWLGAFEARPAYLATKSDHYSTINALPSQNGPGYALNTPAVRSVMARIDGRDGAWEIQEYARLWAAGAGEEAPTSLEPLPLAQLAEGDEAARTEAAFALVSNHEVVVPFATRGASEAGVPGFQVHERALTQRPAPR